MGTTGYVRVPSLRAISRAFVANSGATFWAGASIVESRLFAGKWLANIGLEPSRLLSRAIMSPCRAAQAAR